MTVIIGIDPHKATHVAVAIDGDEHTIAQLEVRADRVQAQRLLAWAAPLGPERRWAIESADGLGKLLSQELLAAGEQVVDVPPTWRHGCACSGRRRQRRMMATTRSQPRSRGCVTADYERCAPTTTRRCSACWPAATTT